MPDFVGSVEVALIVSAVTVAVLACWFVFSPIVYRKRKGGTNV